MTKSEIYSREFDRINQQITALQDYLYEAELYPEQTRPWTRFRRSVFLFLLKRYVFRQIQQLHLRRRAVHNCPPIRPQEGAGEPAARRRGSG